MTELQVTINNLKEVIIAADLFLQRLEKVQKDLEKPHQWEHGDIFKTGTGSIMVYLKFTSGRPRTVCVYGPTGGLVRQKDFNGVLQSAKFLFNIKEIL